MMSANKMENIRRKTTDDTVICTNHSVICINCTVICKYLLGEDRFSFLSFKVFIREKQESAFACRSVLREFVCGEMSGFVGSV